MNPTAETLDLMKTALSQSSKALADDLGKAFTQATGLIAFNLEAPAKRLIPVITPLRNDLPRLGATGGNALNWKAINGINTTNQGAGVSEGNRGAVITTSTQSLTVPFAGLGLEDYVTFEADDASKTFEDVKADAVLGLLQSLMLAEERMLFGGNNTMALGTTPTPVLAASASGGTIGASITVSVIAVALSHEGMKRSSLAGGLPGSISKTNADGSIDTFGGGSGQKSANATVAVSAGSTNSVTGTVTPVAGAVAYAWYVGNNASPGTEKLYAITTINSVLIQTIPGAGQLASALPAADNSTNGLAFDGLMTFASKVSLGGYQLALATGVAGTGTPLTADAAAGIVEITTAFQYWWDNYRLSPDEIWCSAQEQRNITKKVINSGGAPLFRFNQAADVQHSALTGGVVVSGILNPITQTMVELKVHPEAVNGTLLFRTKRLPYKLSNVGDIARVRTRREYYQIDWPLRSRKSEYGVYADELLQVYAPFAFGVITNIANG